MDWYAYNNVTVASDPAGTGSPVPTTMRSRTGSSFAVKETTLPPLPSMFAHSIHVESTAGSVQDR